MPRIERLLTILCLDAVLLIGLSKRPRIHVSDPAFIRKRASLRDGQPAQTERGLLRNLVALEEHLAEYSLRSVFTLFRGE